MAPWVPRMHLFEIDDQPWFPQWFRGRVQAALTAAWTNQTPLIQPVSPARIASRLLASHLADKLSDYVFIDFCAGGGGPTPSIERYINNDLDRCSSRPSSKSKPKFKSGSDSSNGRDNGNANASPTDGKTNGNDPPSPSPVQFVLTDLHPHIENWTLAAARSPNVHFSPDPIDASDAPPDLLTSHVTTLSSSSPAVSSSPSSSSHRKIFRLYNLAFHHFDDPLARRILANTLSTSGGFAIFELQDRSFASFLTLCLLGIGVVLSAPMYAWKWRSPMTLFWCWVIPVLPFVLVFDGWVSSLRTRTAEEVEVLMRTCGMDEKELEKWEVKSGSVPHLKPIGYLNWIICTKRDM